MVWVCAVLSRKDCELACDEAAIKRLGEGERIPYGQTLVCLVSMRPAPSDLLMAVTAMTAGKKEIKERVIQLTRTKRMTKLALTVVLLLAALMAVTTFTGAVVAQNLPSLSIAGESVGQEVMALRVTPDPTLRLDALDLTRVAIPDFDWPSNQDAAVRKEWEKSIRWMYAMGQQFYALPDGNPWKAVDVLVYCTRGYGNWVTLAVKPVGGLDAVRPLFKGGIPHGTGAYSDYVMMEYHVGGLGTETRSDGSLRWVGTRNGAMIVTPAWHRVPPPSLDTWTDELMARWLSWLPTGLSAYEDGAAAATPEAYGMLWAENYVSRHKTMSGDDGNPLKADDVKVLGMTLQAAQPEGDPQTLVFHLRYAFRPVWGAVPNVIGRLLTLYNLGTGDLDGYIIVDAQVTLVKEVRTSTSTVFWTCIDYQYQYGSNYDGNMNISLAFPVPKNASATTYKDLAPVGRSISYGGDKDETKMSNAAPARWAINYAQQFYHLDPTHPLYSDHVAVTSVRGFYPRQTTASGINKVVHEFTADFSLRLHPVGGTAKAQDYYQGAGRTKGSDDKFYPNTYDVDYAVTLTRSTAADGTVTWTCTDFYGAADDIYSYLLTPNYPVPTLPLRVAPRPDYAISALDVQAAYVPDDGSAEDITTRWAVAFGQQFYALPDNNLWKSSDVILRNVSDGWVSLAVKPIHGVDALVPYLPSGTARGQGDLEDYLLIQYGMISLSKQIIPVFGAAPVWTPEREWYAQPLWASAPPDIGSEGWRDYLKYDQWTHALTQSYTHIGSADISRAAGYAIPVGYTDGDAVGRAWAQAYLQQQTNFLSFSRTPVLAEDTKLLDMTLTASGSGEMPQFTYSFQYAYRPMWGLDAAVAYYRDSGHPYALGSGDLAGYIICTYPAVILTKGSTDGWSNEPLED